MDADTALINLARNLKYVYVYDIPPVKNNGCSQLRLSHKSINQ